MHGWYRHFLPFGLVRASQIHSDLLRLGVEPLRALRLAATISTPAKLRHHNLDLLPDATFSDPATIIDIGANRGEWTAAWLSLTGSGHVICVEPDPTLAEVLRKRFGKNQRVEVCEAAAAAVEGTAELNLMEDPVLNSLRKPTESMTDIFPKAFKIRKTATVKTMPLDRISDGHSKITLLKIDAQGFEREIISGAKATLERTECVLLEVNFQPHYQGEAGFVELDSLMQQHGFCIGNYSRPLGGQRQALLADFLYVRQAR